jgi:hypothetical protein
MNYKSKAKDSFRTKFNIYLFKHVLSPEKAPLEFDSFRDYEIEFDMVRLHTTQYWQQKAEFLVAGKKIQDIESEIITVKNGRRDLIKDWETRYVKEIFPVRFPEAVFNSIGQNTECAYCHITVDEIDFLIDHGQINKKRLRGYNLEMDRKNSNYEYYADNCVMCCYWCNNAKTDEFDEKEYQLMGDAMRRIWQVRLSSVKSKA